MPVQFTSNRNTVSNCSAGYLVAGIYDDSDFTSVAKRIDELSGDVVTRLLSNKDLSAKVGSCAIISPVEGLKSKRVLLVRLGKRKKFDADAFQKAMTGAVSHLASCTADSVTVFLDDMELEQRDIQWQAKRAVEILSAGLYVFNQTKSKKKRAKRWRIQLATESFGQVKAIRSGVQIGKSVGAGVSLARDLGNLPGNICTPTYLAKRAGELASYDNVEVEVLEESDMEELGMGSLLSVSRGSREPAKLILIHYSGGKSGERPIVLVGKGLTFDAGGISIKPAGAMDEMKFDMCGGASVIGAMSALAELQLPINVIGAVPSSENLPDGAANKPGDIVTSMSGTTIEILNTDAEGRLILCDALTYVERYRPDTVIDAATLTGACVIALGKFPSGLFTPDDRLAHELERAGEVSGDRVWRMPVWDDYQSQLSSNFADIANIGGRDAGAVTAACFLARFTKKLRWAHLDIAGTAWLQGKQKGSTGRPVYLFVQYLLDRCDAGTRGLFPDNRR